MEMLNVFYQIFRFINNSKNKLQKNIVKKVQEKEIIKQIEYVESN